MKLIKCENNHIYDGNKFRSCPHCSGIVADPLLAAVFGAEQSDVDTNIPEPSQQEHYERISRRKTVGMLICTRGNMVGAGFLLKTGENVIGRAANMDVALVGEITVSRNRQMTIWYTEEDKQYYLDVAKGKSEVLCNQKVVTDRICLEDRDEIVIGDCHLIFIKAGDVW